MHTASITFVAFVAMAKALCDEYSELLDPSVKVFMTCSGSHFKMMKTLTVLLVANTELFSTLFSSVVSVCVCFFPSRQTISYSIFAKYGFVMFCCLERSIDPDNLVIVLDRDTAFVGKPGQFVLVWTPFRAWLVLFEAA
jgi:hypothetical protein